MPDVKSHLADLMASTRMSNAGKMSLQAPGIKQVGCSTISHKSFLKHNNFML